MTDASAPNPMDAADGGPDKAVHASLSWKQTRPVPDLVLSFNGLYLPTALFGELAAMGWDVPPPPPRPSSAIEWVPDPVAGTDYTIHPWRVDDFQLGAGNWNRDQAQAIAVATVATLTRHEAKIDAPPELMGAAGSGKAVDSGADLPAAVAELSAAAPQVILLGYAGDASPQLSIMKSMTSAHARETTVWAESISSIETLSPEDPTGQSFVRQCSHAWKVEYATSPALPKAGQAALCAAVPETAPDDKKLNKLVSMLGGSLQVASLVPLNPSHTQPGALVFGVVPAKSIELAVSSMRLRSSTAIVRDA